MYNTIEMDSAAILTVFLFGIIAGGLLSLFIWEFITMKLLFHRRGKGGETDMSPPQLDGDSIQTDKKSSSPSILHG